MTSLNFILTCSTWALYNNKGRYTVSNLGLLATTSWYSRQPIQHSHTEWQVTLILKWSAHFATSLLHYSTSHASTALLMTTALLYNTDWCLSVAYVQCSYFPYKLDIDAYNSSMAIFCPASWLPLYHLASTWLQLPPSTPLLHGFKWKLASLHSIYYVYLTPIPCSLFHFCPNLATLPHYV